ncbi:helix-turn-helix domain-containing protein [Streptomyces sp. RLB3-17]|jgi:DNA-binding IclR family transcriptional regulator|nr:IclR family transcriptional regulator [Streptomyces sp. WAC00263]PBC98759.1 IclR family transcriptional regulator [Streptomyces sp. Ag82_O1-15]QDN57886.1 helix-turn-helix domain-containing protein [Streptomyces sp. S1D4-20]QDN67983.1 helix-turn-helix domain-containing protein [Streptomyces sp. S1D4-14]QDN78265.1 helix-turn-helix domain-containing protein [Streptomyces sp. S1A1-7]QDN87968.1 helix-turn-helix domain-containing protein [Streptomyces sp. RLB3-6]QDN98612.1 helix-turn-helix domai
MAQKAQGETVALMNEPTAPYHSAQDALRVLETVARHSGGVTDVELARQTGLGTERLTALLRMLRREGYVEQVVDGAYVAGAALGRLGSAHGRDQALREKLQQTIDRLRDSVGAAIYISRYIDGEVHVTQCAEGPATPAVNEWVDFRSSAHASAVGKSLLGQLDLNARRDHLSRHKMARLTSRTITNERLLLSRLDAQPATVPVLDLQEYAIGTVCAAVPITAGSSVGCLALSLPVEHAHRLRRAADTLNRGATPVLLSLAI